jgi:hypothetical protein
MGKKLLVNETKSDLYVTLYVRDGTNVEENSSTPSYTIDAKKSESANYGSEPYLNAISVSCYDMNDGDMSSLSDVALKIGSSTDKSLNMYDTITFNQSGNDILPSYSNTWTV